jgi:hypothetical protein
MSSRLEDAANLVLARQMVLKVEDIILKDDGTTLDAVFEAVECVAFLCFSTSLADKTFANLSKCFRNFTHNVVSSLSKELLQRLAAKCLRMSHYAGVVISFAMSSQLEVIDTYTEHLMSAPFSHPKLVRAASRLCEGLLELNISGAYADDEFIFSLARSGAAKTLRKFVARRCCFISDQSSSAWAALPQLEVVEIEIIPSGRDETLQALSLHPNITSIEIYSSIPTDPELLRIILAPERLPRLKVLTISTPDENGYRELDILLEVLQRRNNLHLIHSVRINTHWRMGSYEKVKQLHRLCPNLTSIHADDLPCIEGIEFLASPLSNLTELSLTAVIPRITPKWVSLELPKYCPLLRTLTVDNIPVTDFSGFGNLENLTVFSRRFENITGWSPSMKIVALDFRRAKPSPEVNTQADSIILSLVPVMGKLTEMTLHFPSESIKRRHLELIVESCNQLRSLSLVCGKFEQAETTGQFILSHPKLVHFPTIANVEGLDVAPGNLPSLESSVSDWDLETTMKVKTSCVPSLLAFSLPTCREDREAELVASVASSFGPSLMQLSMIQLRDHKSFCDSIPAFFRLRHLSISSVTSIQVCQTVFRCLPWLSILAIAVQTAPGADFDFLRHPRLQSFLLRLFPEEGRDQSEYESGGITLSITSAHLPYLNDFRVCNELMSAPMNILLWELNFLQFLNLTGSNDNSGPCQVTINSCPLIDQIYLNTILLNRFEIDSAPHLGFLTFSSLTPGPFINQSTIPTQIPLLNRFHMSGNRKLYNADFEAFVERLRAAVPKNVIWETLLFGY